MNIFEWIIVITLGSTFYVYTAFMALCTALKMRAAAKRAGFDLPWDMKIVCAFLLITGAPADWIYNWTIGNFRFKFQLPWRMLYTERVQWHLDHLEISSNPKQAFRWGVLLNAGEEGHVDNVPESEPVRR